MTKDSVDRMLEQWRRERPDLDPTDLALAARIDILAKLLRQSTANRLASIGLKPWEYDVLSALRRQGAPYQLPATELAKESLLTSGAMTTRVDQLEAKRLVQRSPDPNDRRGVLIHLTRKGVAVVDKGVAARLAAATTSLNGLNERERRSITRGLRKLLLGHAIALTSE